MLGTVGVAPAGREVRSSLVPDKFGGNMDTPEMCPGTTVYLGVNVEGALFSVGDGHYRQGEGESCGTAVEGAMDVTLIVELIKGGAPEWPRLEHDDDYVVVGSARPLEDAWRASQVGMVGWLGELYGLDPLDAYQLLTQISLSPLANVVDVNYSAVTKVPKRFLPAAQAYGGMHRHLRAQAAALWSQPRRRATRSGHGRVHVSEARCSCSRPAGQQQRDSRTSRTARRGGRRGLDDGRGAVGVHHERGVAAAAEPAHGVRAEGEGGGGVDVGRGQRRDR